MQTQDNTKMCYPRGNRRTRRKTFLRPSKLKSIHWWISWNTRITKDPSNLVYPMFLSLLNSCYQRTSRSLVFTSFLDPAILLDCICQASPSSFGKSPKLPKLQNTLYALKRCGLCLGTNLLSKYDNGRGTKKRLQWFLTKGWVALFLKGGCVVL